MRMQRRGALRQLSRSTASAQNGASFTHDRSVIRVCMSTTTGSSGCFTLRSRFNLARQQWSTVEHLQLHNPNSALDVVRTPDGKILLVYNDNRVARVPLSLAMSDDGRHFTKVHDLENAQRGKWFSYPAII